MFFTHKRVMPTGYAATRFLLTYFIVGLLILSLAFVYYTKQILQLNQALEEQVGPLARLPALIPEVKEKELSNRLTQIVKELLMASRLSFIITDATDGRIVIAKGVDEAIERKINPEPSIPLSPTEQSKLKAILERMAKKNEPRQIQYSLEDRALYAYLYHGDADGTAIDRIPFVFADLNGKPQQWRIWGEALVTAKQATPDQTAQAQMLIRNFKALGREIPLQTIPDPHQGYFYYEATRYYGIIVMPVVLAGVFCTFLVVGFLSYRRIQSSEQAAIWGGLAKETAHQLGTPISSLMGWLELLTVRNQEHGGETVSEIYADMQNDLVRLQKITERFGRIGSDPQKTEIDVNAVIGDVVLYFQKRLPNRSKPIEIRTISRELPHIFANADLLQWVFENLIRNSLDAIDKASGLIEIDPRFDAKNHQIIVQYRDNGKGIMRKNRRKIFHPGVTTKNHGWGLGLTLVKRIVEGYHYGQIRLMETGPDGTTFEIVLPVGTAVDGETAGNWMKGSLHEALRMRLRDKKKEEVNC
jgi:two-component sensor histidine kinase